MKQIAQLFKTNLGVEAAFTKVSGWDTHQNQGGVNGEFANRLHDFDVLGEVVTRTLSAKNLDAVVPGAQLNRSGFLRIV